MSSASTALGYGDSRPQTMGAARPSAVGITASSVVTKIVNKINNSYTSTRVSSLLGHLKQLYCLSELIRGVATTFTCTREFRHLPSILTHIVALMQ